MAAEVSSQDDSMPSIVTLWLNFGYFYPLIIKGIKKALKIFAGFLIVILILLLACFFLIRTERAQTYITQKIAGYFSEEWRTTVEVDRVYIDFFKTAVVEGVYVEDLHSDTLLYAKKLEMELTLFGFDKIQEQVLNIDELFLEKANFKLKKYKGEEHLNLQFVLDYFASEDTAQKEPWEITANILQLADVHFSYEDKNKNDTINGINFADLSVLLSSFDAEEVQVQGSDVTANINQLLLKEKSGFGLQEFAAQFSLTKNKIALKKLNLKTPDTYFIGEWQMDYENFGSFSEFTKKVKLIAGIEGAKINAKDIAYFVPALQGLDKSVAIRGDVKGKLMHLKGKGIELYFADETQFKGDFDIEGLPDIENTFIFLHVNSMQTNKQDLEKIPIPPFNEGKTLQVPVEIARLGMVNFEGRFTGFVNDFVANGNFKTALGEVSTDIEIFEDTIYDTYDYVGNVSTGGFNLGALVANNQLGQMQVNVNVDGRGFTAEDAIAKLNGSVSRFDFNGYSYKNAKVDAQVANKQFEGNLTINDPNLALDFKGKVDYTGKVPLFSFEASADTIRPARLKLVERDASSFLSFSVSSNLKGDRIDDLDGVLNATDVFYTEKGKTLNVGQLTLTAENRPGGQRMLNLESDLVNANIVGAFNYSQVVQAVQYELAKVFPTFYAKAVEPITASEDFTYTVTVYNAKQLTGIFLPKLKLPGFINLVGNFNSNNGSATAQLNTSEIAYSGRKVKDVEVNLDLANRVVKADAVIGKLFLSDSLVFNGIKLMARAADDKMQFGLDWNELIDSANYVGDINGLAIIEGNKKFNVKFNDTYFTVADTVWKVNNGNSIKIDSSAVAINALRIQHKNQYINIEGTISENESDKLKVDLQDFDLSNFNLVTAGVGLDLGGTVSGTAKMASVYKNLELESLLALNKLSINEYSMGSGRLQSAYDNRANKITLSGNLTDSEGQGFDFNGSYSPRKKKNSINITANLNEFRLGIIQPLIEEHVTDFTSEVSGKIKVTGTPEEPLLNGKLTLYKTTFLVNYLNTKYTTSEVTMNVLPDMFSFDFMEITDSKGDKALVNGTILHENFKDINFDVSLDAQKFQVLNTNEAHNDLYYGTAFITGLIDVSGYADNLIIDARVKTEKGTQFNIPLGGPTEIGNVDYIKFVDADNIFAERQEQEQYEANLDGLQLNFEIEATPDAEMRLIFDERIGDIVTTRGSGSLKMGVNTLGRFNMYGTYEIEKGDYLLTLQNIINKKFSIEKGSSITWNGDPLGAQLDIDAVYGLRAPLYDIMGGDSTYKSRVPVDAHLLVTGKLEEPNIEFDIELPTVDQTTASVVKSQIRSPQEMNQQVFTLLLLNRFKAPNKGNEQRANIGTTTSTELLSNQLSNWLSQISDEFDIGVNYRAGDEVSNEELEVALSTQILNDRVVLEGNFGVEGNKNQSNDNTIVGDFKVEYKITEDGQFRAKVFNETNDNIIAATSSPYTQGAGFVYTKEFDTFGEFFRSIFKRKGKARKEDE